MQTVCIVLILHCLGMLLPLSHAAQPSAPAATAKYQGTHNAKLAPAFRLPSRDGGLRTLDNYRGQLLLLNFWATWCGPCRAEIAVLARAQKRWGPHGVRIVGVAMDSQGWRTVTPFLQVQPADYDVVLGNPRIARAYGAGRVYPTTVVVDRQGRIVGHIRTALDDDDLNRLLFSLTSLPE
ncbi:MAG: TlpA family protein disulfide reductase [Bryobacterales bacterium]|nr:TlpA family protein disulfide reductase [Bryobacterales bacterium]